jgi:hypothetical protein
VLMYYLMLLDCYKDLLLEVVFVLPECRLSSLTGCHPVYTGRRSEVFVSLRLVNTVEEDVVRLEEDVVGLKVPELPVGNSLLVSVRDPWEDLVRISEMLNGEYVVQGNLCHRTLDVLL